ncbi:hypothetical protein A6R72_10750 [Xanthomonas translucens pv. graminis]|nr:hypothetical protein A6R72_10750 [Xanthomonas translucens pv. graminis]
MPLTGLRTATAQRELAATPEVTALGIAPAEVWLRSESGTSGSLGISLLFGDPQQAEAQCATGQERADKHTPIQGQ